MKRDINLFRKILLKIEEDYIPNSQPMVNVKIENYDFDTIVEHCKLLQEAGMITTFKPVHGGGKIQMFFVGGLSNIGYDFLESIKSDKIWNATKKSIIENEAPQNIDIIRTIANHFNSILINNFININQSIDNSVDNAISIGNDNKINKSSIGEFLNLNNKGESNNGKE